MAVVRGTKLECRGGTYNRAGVDVIRVALAVLHLQRDSGVIICNTNGRIRFILCLSSTRFIVPQEPVFPCKHGNLNKREREVDQQSCGSVEVEVTSGQELRPKAVGVFPLQGSESELRHPQGGELLLLHLQRSRLRWSDGGGGSLK